MKQWVKYLLIMSCLWLASASAQAAVNCTISATGVTGIYNPGGGVDVQIPGSLTLSCTRLATDPASQYLYIGMDFGTNSAGRSMSRQTAPNNNAVNRLAYSLFRNADYSGSWRESGGRLAGAGGAGGLYFLANFGSGTTYSTTIPYYFFVNNGANTVAAAGIYDDTIGVTLRLSDITGLSTGSVLNTTSFVANISVLKTCRFSTAPVAINLTYASFSANPVTGNTTVQLNCTYTTTYTLALDATSGTIVGLNYTLALNASSGTGSGFAQSYTVTATIAAGQSGNCTTGTCAGTRAHVLTITY